jgi:hypothetical protein
MTNRKIAYWVLPPEAAAEFVAPREEVLETYEKPYHPHMPVLCMDEQPVQLLKETRSPSPPRPNTPSGSTTHTHERGRPLSSCSPSLGLAGVQSPFANGKRRALGPSPWLGCWRAATLIAPR